MFVVPKKIRLDEFYVKAFAGLCGLPGGPAPQGRARRPVHSPGSPPPGLAGAPSQDLRKS